MKRITLALTVMLVWLVGCARPPIEPPPAPAASNDKVQQLRRSYMAINPNARVGIVTRVLPEHRLAAVGDVPVQDFEAGQSIHFIDSDRKTLTVGRIVNITDLLLVKYDEPKAGGRAPREGDVAVRVQ